MSAFKPVYTKADLETLDAAEIVAGYLEYRSDDPEPGTNRSRAFWHGWRNAAIDHGRIPHDAACAQLAQEVALRVSPPNRPMRISGVGSLCGPLP